MPTVLTLNKIYKVPHHFGGRHSGAISRLNQRPGRLCSAPPPGNRALTRHSGAVPRRDQHPRSSNSDSAPATNDRTLTRHSGGRHPGRLRSDSAEGYPESPAAKPQTGNFTNATYAPKAEDPGSFVLLSPAANDRKVSIDAITRRTPLLRHILSIMLTGLLLGACTSDFEEINKSQTGLTADRFDEDLLFTRSLVYGALRYTEYQRAQQLYAHHYIQYYSVSVPYFPTDRYVTRNDWLTAYWREAYADFGMQTQQAIDLTESNPAKSNKTSIARIWKVFIMHRLTDFWGDVPYFEAFQGDVTPAYTPQEQIYEDMLTVLEEEAANLATPSIESFGNADVVYQGDRNLWIKFANSLRLRLAMRLSEVNPTLAQQHVSAVLAEDNLISDNSESALLPYGKDFGNATENIQPMSVLRNFNEYRVSNTLVDFLQETNDPRLPLLVEPNEEGNYVGLPNGLNPEQLNALDLSNFSRDTDIIANQAAPTGLLIYPEVLFLKAEAALRGWAPGSAQQYYEDGVQASINFWNSLYVDLKNTLPAEEADALPTVTVTDSAISAYVAQPAIAYNAATGLEQIITQKWVALLNQGFEAYAEYRRTGFPALNPIPNTNGESETGGPAVPVRVQYPAEEQTLNRIEYNAAVARQGPDLPTTRVWWDVQ